ncbi:hypothetical protein GYMLUDRAFT_244160 [Collybiopsis luxurians FD-317 M1]|uniref:Uncharacterized protein n=1 Tax=Collybiopsis luxurians FD-317 M1 TaxID=944289 RepID=A0A0D0BXY9_9AGAR|nr:hypothetical protein GYMLUDRAFT_244160 [Collybiopsis luxurians FD-317 M1]
MSPPVGGHYYIQNKVSGYYVTSDGKDSFSTPVTTTIRTGDLDVKFVFNLTKVDIDQYFISSLYSGVDVGAPAIGSTVIWTVKERKFKIMDAGPGLFNIRLLGEHRFWCDDVASEQPFHTVLLDTGSPGDSCSWMLIAA